MPEHLKRASNSRIQKSNLLVDARYKLTMWETRIFIKMIMMIDHSDEDNKEYHIYPRDIIDDFQLYTDKSAYRYIREAADSLRTRSITFPETTENGDVYEVNTSILTVTKKKIKGKPDAFIKVKFAAELKPYLLELKEYTSYDLKYILRLPNSYAFRMYEILKSFEFRKKKTIDFQELKEMIGAAEITFDESGVKEIKDLYPLFGSFKQKILNKAQKHINNNTDIRFDFEPVKSGRKITAITFMVNKNEVIELEDVTPELPFIDPNDEDRLVNSFLQQVGEWVVASTVRKWVQQYPPAQIQQGITYTLNKLKAGDKIKNVGGYLQKMVSTSDLVDTAGKKLQEEKAAKKKAEERAAKREEMRALETRLNETLREKTDEACRAVFEKHPDAKENAFETAKKRRGSSYKADLTNAENMANPAFRAIFKLIVQERFPEQFAGVADLKKEVSKVRSAISRLK
ncbi:replication initiation protein [Neolewinella persica]|uniref:replication initiation protein n=1 Tax=Neolewinella persica TaxID=70998 RepID=UPI00036832F7|nr:replication initiation protein [Neolewinella persica]